MSVESLGVLSVGAINASASLAIAQVGALQIGASAKLAELQASLAAALTPPTPLDPITALQGLATFLVGYNPAFVLQALAEQIPSLSADVAQQALTVEAAINLVAEISAPLKVGGLSVYKFTGAASALGSEVGAEVSGGLSGDVQALVIVTENPAAFAALLKSTLGVA